MPSRRLHACRCLELPVILTIIIAIWLLSFLPVMIYFPLSAAPPSNTEWSNLKNSTYLDVKTIDDVMSVCKQEFFSDTANDSQSPGQCKPKCSSWLTFSQSSELASKVVIGLSTVIGMLTTIMIIILSFVCFKNILEFPSVLILYQDIIVSLHGANVLIGFTDRRLFCTSDDLIETFISPASIYCTISGMFSSYMTLSLTVWIAIQVNYVLITVYFPLYFYQRKGQKWKRHFVHIVSLLAGIISLIVPAMLTLGLGGYSPLGTKFPPIVCFARKRDITMYIFLIPVAVLIAIIITGLVLIFHFLVRNTRTRKDFKIAEVKVVIFCCCYVIYGFGASLAYSLSSAFSSRLETELIDYFECEKEYKIDRECSRSGFETFINPTLQILPWSMIALYPVTTLVYFMCNKKAMCNRFNLKHKVTKQLSTLVHPPPSAI